MQIIDFIDFLVNTWILCFLLKYFMEPYRFYGFGGVSSIVDWCTEPLCKRIRKIISLKTDDDKDLTPFLAILLLVIARGFLYWATISGAGLASPIPAFQYSFIALLSLITKTLTICFIISVLLSKYGVATYSIVLINVINDISFSIFRGMRKILKTENLFALLFSSIMAVILASGMIYMVLLMKLYLKAAILFEVGICTDTLSFFVFVIIVYALMSWVAPDPHNPIVQLIKAIAEPFISITRRIFPWGNLGMIDFTPIITVFLIILLKQVIIRIFISLFAVVDAASSTGIPIQ